MPMHCDCPVQRLNLPGRRLVTGRRRALNLYRERPGPLTGDQHADALVVAEVAARWVLEAQAGAPPDTVAEELEVSADFHFMVHNAAGPRSTNYLRSWNHKPG
jgi:hypothetical protein